MRHRPFLVVLSSPSGAGKTSICRGVIRRDPHLAYSVSATTRPRRTGETHGRDYWFYTERQFLDRVRRGGMVEHARVYDHWYGTPRARLQAEFRRGRDVIADLDVQGMRSGKTALPDMVGIFITVPDRDELARRLRRRGTDSAEAISRREQELEAEFAALPDFDYTVKNDRLERAVTAVLGIIRAERCRVARQTLNPILRRPGRK